MQKSLENFQSRFEILFEKIQKHPLVPFDLSQILSLSKQVDSDQAQEDSFLAKIAYVERHLAETQKLQCSYFFLLGLQMKMDLGVGQFVLRVFS